ncbi:bifunctional phosphoglucose/phosphomannose isomerase [Solirubrobacter sp. CPCC 204708]|uniref:Bifunctional phosphoglucose/phosphomannose isomerase n=1 Tax=Solirubrobacter deserti TaxID=2282478 RepID=A0ABT4RIT9_9ACTN|nr:bifunctional phosphoglucose/phosphomannose isomerase [Solirubrobacter deserti]MBE2320219.1 bifunctional phosphoglucose/phosphomannose isomerase [Solirubrobacter deserti]MDA0138395.1 bifunctional phosphoglucose/phosphomannose isomerase [Solirubrobacter deserti]
MAATRHPEVRSRASLERSVIEEFDSTNQLDAVLGLPHQLTHALVRVDRAELTPIAAPGGVIVAGMGGSAAGARLAVAALGQRLTAPLVVSDGYRLPGWAGPNTLVFASSYSGNTEETLAAYDEAAERGAPRIAATTGGGLAERAGADGVPVIALPTGFQPRATIGYALVAALEAAAIAGAAPSVRHDIIAAAVLAADLVEEWGPESPDDSLAKSIARAVHGTIPVFAGAELAGAAAYRWKCQFNENAALPAFASILPEADHNEVVGWDAARALGRFSYVSLEDPRAHERNALRAELTADIARAGADPVLRVPARGHSAMERLVSLVLLGDLVSLYAAVLREADPVDIPAIDGLKAALAAR